MSTLRSYDDKLRLSKTCRLIKMHKNKVIGLELRARVEKGWVAYGKGRSGLKTPVPLSAVAYER